MRKGIYFYIGVAFLLLIYIFPFILWKEGLLSGNFISSYSNHLAYLFISMVVGAAFWREYRLKYRGSEKEREKNNTFLEVQTGVLLNDLNANQKQLLSMFIPVLYLMVISTLFVFTGIEDYTGFASLVINILVPVGFGFVFGINFTSTLDIKTIDPEFTEQSDEAGKFPAIYRMSIVATIICICLQSAFEMILIVGVSDIIIECFTKQSVLSEALELPKSINLILLISGGAGLLSLYTVNYFIDESQSAPSSD